MVPLSACWHWVQSFENDHTTENCFLAAGNGALPRLWVLTFLFCIYLHHYRYWSLSVSFSQNRQCEKLCTLKIKVYQEVVSGAYSQSEQLCLQWLYLTPETHWREPPVLPWEPVVLPAWRGNCSLGWQLHSEGGSEQYVQLTKQDQTSTDNWLHLCGNVCGWLKLACLVLHSIFIVK